MRDVATAVLEEDEGRRVKIVMTPSSSSLAQQRKGRFYSSGPETPTMPARSNTLYSQFPGFLGIITWSHCSFNLLLLKITLLCLTKMHLEYRLLKENMPRW